MSLYLKILKWRISVHEVYLFTGSAYRTVVRYDSVNLLTEAFCHLLGGVRDSIEEYTVNVDISLHMVAPLRFVALEQLFRFVE